MAFFVCHSEMQSDCGCLSVWHDVYDNVPTACMDGWSWMFFYWPSFSHHSPMQRLKTPSWKVNVPWQPIPLPKIPTTSLERKHLLGREQRPKYDWEKLVSKTVQRKRKLYFLQEPTWFITYVEMNREGTKEVIAHVKRKTGKSCVKQTAQTQTFLYVLPWPTRGQL